MNTVLGSYWRQGCFVAALTVAALASVTKAQTAAPEFPPGLFSDGGHYKISDFKGKALVLFFYEQDCPKCRGLIPERNKVVEQFKDKPVKFIAIGAGDNLNEANAYVRGTRLEMPSFADAMGVMEARYGFHISLQNIYQFRMIGPDGKMVGGGIDFTPASVEAAIKDVKWKYKDAGYDPKLNPVIELLEWNQYEPAVRQLKPATKIKGAVGESATKLLDAVKAEGKAWLDDAEKTKSTDPVAAYDLYSKVSSVFAGEDMAKTADAVLKDLKKDKAVVDELAARQMYAGLFTAMSKAVPQQRQQVLAYCQSISTKYPNTPTGKQAADLANDITKAGQMAQK